MPYVKSHTVATDHAFAVRNAIQTARVVNEQWLALGNGPAACKTGTMLDYNAPITSTPSTSTGALARYIPVSAEEVLLGLRIGDRLVVIDDANNKNSGAPTRPHARVRGAHALTTKPATNPQI